MKTMFARRSLARGAEEEEDGRDDGRRRRTDAEALAALGSYASSRTSRSRASSECQTTTRSQMTMVTETRGEIGAREIDYKRGGEARVGIKPGDVVAFVTPDESHPYVCVDEIDEARDGQRKYRFVIDTEGDGKGSANALREREACQLEVLTHNGFVGFRCAYANDRLLQATRHARHRLGFASANFGTWEEWILDEGAKRALNDAAWTRCEVTLRHRRLDAYKLKVTVVRLGCVVDTGTDDDARVTVRDEHRGRTSRQSTPGGSVRTISTVERFRLTRDGEATAHDRSNFGAAKPHAMHAMGGALMKEWVAALEKEVAARRVIEQELHDLHESDDKLRDWALSELHRLREFAQSEVDNLAKEVEDRNEKMADLKQQRRALELRGKMLENLDEERLNSIVARFKGLQQVNLVRRCFTQWRRESGSIVASKSIELAFSKYQDRDYRKRSLTNALAVWRRAAATSKRTRRVYSSVLNRYASVAFRTWANEVKSVKLRDDVQKRVAPSQRVGVHLNNALTIGYQMQGSMKHHQLRRSVVAHAKRMPDVRVDLVEAAFDCGEETENAAMYKLSDALSDPIGAINLAREAVLKHIPTDDVEYGEAIHAFDEGITVASRMIQMRETYLWMNADTVPEAMALTYAYDVGEDAANASRDSRSAARRRILAQKSRMASNVHQTFMRAFYRGSFARDYSNARRGNIREGHRDAFDAGLEAGLCRYKRREIMSEARSPEEMEILAVAFDGGVAYACLCTRSSSHARVQMLVDSAHDEHEEVHWMRETLMTTMEVAAGGFLSTNTELLLHKILYPLRTNLMRAALRAWHKVLKTEKEKNLVVQRFVLRTERRLLKESLFGWRNAVLDLKTKRMVLRGICLKIQNATESRYFRLWSDNVAKLMRDRARLTQMLKRMARRRVYAAFSAWADLSTAHEDRLDKIIDIMNGRMRRVHLAKAFAGWLDKAQTAIANRNKARGFIMRHRYRVVSKSFLSWHEHAQTQKINRVKIQKVITRSQNRLASMAFYQWSGLVTSKARHAALVSRFVTRMRVREVSAAINKWYDVMENEKRKRAVFTKVLRTITQKHLAATFNRWREFAAESYDVKVRLRKVVSHMLRLRLSQAFTLWNDRTVEMRRQRAVVGRFVARMRNRRLASSFTHWLDVVEERKQTDQRVAYRERLAGNIMARMNRSTLRAAFDKWYSVVEEREMHREMLRRMLRTKRVAMNFFMTWYWDAFDGDIQDTMADMFGATRTFMNEAFEGSSLDLAPRPTGLDFIAHRENDVNVFASERSFDDGDFDDASKSERFTSSPPAPEWRSSSSGDYDDGSRSAFHVPRNDARARDDVGDDARLIRVKSGFSPRADADDAEFIF